MAVSSEMYPVAGSPYTQGENHKALERWLGIERESHFRRTSAVGVDDDFVISHDQVRYPSGARFQNTQYTHP